MRLQAKLRSVVSWYSERAEPSSTSSLSIVFRATPVIRAVARIEFPFTKQRTTATCSSVLSLFILNIMLDSLETVKHNVQYEARITCAGQSLVMGLTVDQNILANVCC